MNTNQLYTKAGWIETVRQLAQQLPDPAAVSALSPIVDPSAATAEDCAEKINAIIAALQDMS